MRSSGMPFEEAVKAGKVISCQDEVDAAFIVAVKSQALPGPRDLKIIYSPLHGVGASAVMPALVADGFTDVEVFGPHAEPDGDFPNVPGHVANPENPAVFEAIIARAKETGADIVILPPIRIAIGWACGAAVDARDKRVEHVHGQPDRGSVDRVRVGRLEEAAGF